MNWEVVFDIIHSDIVEFLRCSNLQTINASIAAFIPNSMKKINEVFLKFPLSESKVGIHIPGYIRHKFEYIDIIVTLYSDTDSLITLSTCSCTVSIKNENSSCPERLIFKTILKPAQYVCCVVWIYSCCSCDCVIPELDLFSEESRTLVCEAHSSIEAKEDSPKTSTIITLEEQSSNVIQPDVKSNSILHLGTSESSANQLLQYSRAIQLFSKPRAENDTKEHKDFIIQRIIPLLATFSCERLCQQVHCSDPEFLHSLCTLQLSCQYLFHSLQYLDVDDCENNQI